MPRKKRHHYVPQLYLKGFCHDPKQSELFVFDKIDKRQFPSNVINVAQSRYFHDSAPKYIAEGEPPQKVEDLIAVLEGTLFKPQLETFISEVEGNGISEVRREAMAFFLMLQMLRTNEYRQRMDALFKQGLQPLVEFAERTGCPYPIPDLSHMDAYEQNMASYWHGLLLLDWIGIYWRSQPLTKHIFLVGVNNSSTPFWTSDNPVIHTCHIKPFSTWEGLEAEGTEILYPLNHRLILVLRERTYFADDQSFDGKCKEFTEQEVIEANANQLAQCSRQVYSPSDDWWVADEVIKLYPEICKPEHDPLKLASVS